MLLSPFIFVLLFSLALPEQRETLLRCFDGRTSYKFVLESMMSIILSQKDWVFESVGLRLVQSWNGMFFLVYFVLIFEFLGHYAVINAIKASLCGPYRISGCFKIIVLLLNEFVAQSYRKSVCRSRLRRVKSCFWRQISWIIKRLLIWIKDFDHVIRHYLRIVTHLLLKVRQIISLFI